VPTLTIDVSARLASFQDSLDKIGRQGEAMANRLDRAFGGLKASIVSLGAGLSVGAFASLVKNSIDAADELNKLSQKVGITVERLSELKFAANLSDVSIEKFQLGMKGLNETLVKASDATSKEAALLKTLGVTAKDPANALRQVSDAFAVLPDGATKSALAVELFGKAGMEMIPMLNGGSKALDEAAASARKLGLVFSAETAKAAEEFNDNMRKLGSSAEALGISLTTKIIGGLSEFTTGLVKAKEEGKLLTKVMDDMLGTSLELASQLPVLGKLFGALRDANAQRVAELSKNQQTSADIIRGAQEFSRPFSLVGPQISPAQLEANIKSLLAKGVDKEKKQTGPSFEDILAQGALKRLQIQDAETEQAEKDFAEAQKERLDYAYQAALQAAKLEDEQIDRLADIAAKNREISQTYIDLIDPVEKYRKQLEEINRLATLAPSEGGLTSDQAELAREKVNEQIRKLSTDLDKSKDIARELGLTFQSAFEDAIVGGKKFREVLSGIAQDIARIVLRKSVTEPAGAAIAKLLNGGSSSSGGSVSGGIVGTLGDMIRKTLGFASGGSFMVGGSGGTDSQMVAFRASPNERVTIETPEQQRRAGGSVFNFSIDARGADAGVAQRIEQAVRQAVQLSLQAVQAQADRGGSFARAVGRR